MVICVTCQVKFDTNEEFKVHFLSTWHNFNLKRSSQGKSVFSRDKFAQIQALIKEEREVKKGKDHLKSDNRPTSNNNTLEGDLPSVYPTAEKKERVRIPRHTDAGRDYDLCYSLFDSQVFENMNDTLRHLERQYRFTFPQFLPNLMPIAERKYWTVRDPKYSDDDAAAEEEEDDDGQASSISKTPDTKLIKDLDNIEKAEGDMASSDEEEEMYEYIPIKCNGKQVKVNGKFALIYYLGSIIWRANDCIYCDRHFKDGANAVHKHMLDCGHQKFNYAMEDEIQVYFDWQTWYLNLQKKYALTLKKLGRNQEDEEDDEEPSVESMMQTIGYYEGEDGNRLIVGGSRILENRKNLRALQSRGLDQRTLMTMRNLADRRKKFLAIGDGSESEMAEKRRQMLLERKGRVEKHDYRCQFRNHRLKNIVNMQIAYMMNQTGH